MVRASALSERGFRVGAGEGRFWQLAVRLACLHFPEEQALGWDGRNLTFTLALEFLTSFYHCFPVSTTKAKRLWHMR